MLQPPQNQRDTGPTSSWFATIRQLDPFQPREGKAESGSGQAGEAGRAAVRPSSAGEAAGAGPVPADKRKQLHHCSNLCPTASGPGAFLSAGAQPAVTAASFQPQLCCSLLLPAAERDAGADGPSMGPSEQGPAIFRASVLLTLVPSRQVGARVSILLSGKIILLTRYA